MLRDTPALRLARWRPIRVGEDLDAAARGYARKLAEMLGTPPVLDVVLLGVGEDGHVASLFPGHDPVGAWVAPVHDAPKPPAARISLTYAMLLAANRVYIAALGSGKASIIQALVRGDAHETPAGRVLAGARDPRLFLDPAAAAGIRDVNT
jgi:6-phosphogluconolactonase